MPNTPRKLIIHHDGASRSGDSFDVINAYHKGLGFPISSLGYFVGYQYLIERSGKLRQAREDNEIGAHTVGENATSIGICLAGNFDIESPTPAQVATLGQLMLALVETYNIPDTAIYPHRQYAKKSCYGSRLHDLWAREVLADARGAVPDASKVAPREVVAGVIKQLQEVIHNIP